MMNLQLPTIFQARRRFATAVLALVLFFTVAAQAAEQRWLLVFDTSSAMKKRLPAVETEIRSLLTKELASSLHAGDSIGIWTFDEKLHMGEVPLLTWDPKTGGELATNLVNYIHRQNYSGNTHFAVLQPILGTVIGDSERLTVIIFCDGADEIHGTPYDEGINQTLKQTFNDRKKALQPYVIVLRTQTGKYVGGTVNFPPVAANLPPFPLLPREIQAAQPQPPRPPAPVVKPAPVVAAPALIIVGKHVSSDTNDIEKFQESKPPVAVVEKTNPPAEAVAAPQAPVQPVAAQPVAPLPEPVPATVIPPTVGAKEVAATKAPAPGVKVPEPAPVAPEAAPAAKIVPATSATNEAVVSAISVMDHDTKLLTYVGIGLLVVAIGLVIFLITHRSAPRGSLITSSMQSNPRPPEQK